MKTFGVICFYIFGFVLINTLFAQNALELYYKGIEAYNNDDYDQALNYFVASMENEPPDSIKYYIYICSGDICDEFNNYDDAIQFYTFALTLCPTCYPAYNYRGIDYCYVKDYENAERDFLKMLEYIQDDPAIYNNLGYVNNLSKNYNKAVKYLSEAIRIKPNYILAFLNRGYSYSNLNDKEKATSDFTIGIFLEPDNPSQYYMRGEGLYFLKKYKEAIIDWKEAIELNPDYENELRGKIKKAEQLLKK